MSPRWEAIEQLFHEALEKTVAEREEFVRRAADNPQVADEVLALLEAESGDEVPHRPLSLPELMDALDSAFLIGRRVGAYRVGELLGEGGMGQVYRATDERDGQQVAIKVLPPDQARHPRRVARFLRESRALAAVHHPSIVAIRDAGADQGIHYLVMEHLEGETLRQRVARDGPFPLPQSLAFGRAMAAALRAAHEAGVTHRDLKPENVMLTATGPKIFDFGLAHLEESENVQRTTLENALAGTVSYLAPEQIEGAPATAQSDLFALGVVLHEAVTGQTLFQRANPIATARAILDEEPDFRSVPAELRPVLQRCLAKNPRNRYASAAELEADLQNAATADPSRRNRRKTAIAAAAALLLLAGGAGWLWTISRGPAPIPQVFLVPATTDIWLAGQPVGTSVTGYFGIDRAPAQSPVEVRVHAGDVLTFAASGSTSVNGSCFASTPDGGCYPDESPFGSGPANGLSAIAVPASALIGVFVDDRVPAGAAPPHSDFTGGKRSFATLAPLLHQVFFIGDGRRGTGEGAIQKFTVPAGATRLFLAVSDSLGGSAAEAGNLGTIRVVMTDSTRR